MKTSIAFCFGFSISVLVLCVELATGQGCSSNPCENNGVCLDTTSGFFCNCPQGFSGDTCEIDEAASVCEHNTCGHGGTCSVVDGAVRCNCTSEFTGPTCDTRVNITTVTTTPPTTARTIPQNSTGSGSNEDREESVDSWIFIAIAVAAVIVVILVVVLIVCIRLKGKSSSDNSEATRPAPHMIAEFSNNSNQENNTSNPTYAKVHRKKEYNARDSYHDSPPPSYDHLNRTSFDDSYLTSHDDSYLTPYNDYSLNGASTLPDNSKLSYVNNFDDNENPNVAGFDSDYKFEMY